MRTRSRPGFLMIDVLTALFILAALSAALTAVVSGRSRAARKLADTRAAVRLAEHALAELQHGRPTPTNADGTNIQVTRLEGAATIGNNTWVQIHATVRGQSAVLLGLVSPTTQPTEVPP